MFPRPTFKYHPCQASTHPSNTKSLLYHLSLLSLIRRSRLASSTRTSSENTGGTEQRRRPKTKAPLVDSALLRFISTQKNSGTVLLRDESDQSTAGTAISLDVPNGKKRGVELDLPTFASETLSATETEQDDRIKSSTKSIESQSWLSQYNAQRTALKLQAMGVETEAANKAGKIVQDYVLARITRRRIRKFLQERDVMWESGYSVPDNRSGINESVSAAAASTFDIDSVISVMTEHGLTGTDIAAVFTHTPSLAMMRARRDGSEKENDGTTAGEKSFTLEDTLDRALVGLLGETLGLRRYDARKVRFFSQPLLMALLFVLHE